jgi:hypothetical protein
MSITTPMETPSPPQGVFAPSPERPGRGSALLASEWLHLAGTVALYVLPAFAFIRSFSITDPDIWWHLRTGQWILAHHAVPATDPFSLYGMTRPWVEYSWLFDTLVGGLFGRFGLVGIVFYEIAVRLALAVALFHLVRSLLSGFWRAIGLTALGLYAMMVVVGPRPGMLTILFVILEFDLLLWAERTGHAGRLWLLPPMFALWANWHIQFVYGLFVLGVFAAEPAMNAVLRYRPRDGRALPPRQTWFVLGTSALATLLNPYGARVYSTVFLYMGQTRVYDLISELRAMTFRQPQNYVVLLLALGAAMAIGWRRDARPLWLVLLAVTSALAFRSVREVWFLVIVALCVIAGGWRARRREIAPRGSLGRRALVGVWVLAILAVSCRHYGLSNSLLDIQVAGSFPEAAVRYVQQHHLRGPLLNDLSWGGYLIWRLPQLPVAMDGRTNVEGQPRIVRFSKIWKGKPGWNSDPALARAGVVITPRDAAIAALLRMDPRFRVAYQDTQAVVFERR